MDISEGASGCLSIGDHYRDAALSEQVFDIPKAESESVVEPNGMVDDFRWKTVAFVAGSLEPIVAIYSACGST